MGNPLQGIDGDIWYAGLPSVALGAAEAFTDSGDHINYNSNTHDWWDTTVPITVSCSPNGSTGWVVVTDYVFIYGGGHIIFNTARIPGTNNFVRVNVGNYFNIAQLGDCYSWDLSLAAQTQKSTVFQAAGGWELNATVSKSATGKLTSFRYDDTLSKDMATIPVGMQLWISKTANMRWEMMALIQSIGPKVKVGALVEQDAAFVSVGPATLVLS